MMNCVLNGDADMLPSIATIVECMEIAKDVLMPETMEDDEEKEERRRKRRRKQEQERVLDEMQRAKQEQEREREEYEGGDFKASIERYAQSHGLVFRPKRGANATHDGKQVYLCGDVHIVMADECIYARISTSPQSMMKQWVPLSLMELLARVRQ